MIFLLSQRRLTFGRRGRQWLHVLEGQGAKYVMQVNQLQPRNPGKIDETFSPSTCSLLCNMIFESTGNPTLKAGYSWCACAVRPQGKLSFASGKVHSKLFRCLKIGDPTNCALRPGFFFTPKWTTVMAQLPHTSPLLCVRAAGIVAHGGRRATRNGQLSTGCREKNLC